MDLQPIFTWWLVILIFGLVGWSLAFSLLRYLPDRGFAVARPLGLLLTGYILWLGGTFRLLQNNVSGTLVALFLVLLLGLIWQRQSQNQKSKMQNLEMLTWLKQEWRYVLSIELLFNVAFVGWVIFKAYNPNIETVGGEKWMEIAFINGTLRSDYFPPQDPWLSGFAISYYYFGYVLMAMVTRLTGIVSTTAFNLYVPTLFAMTLTVACGIVANLVSLYQTAQTSSENPKLKLPSISSGFLAALLVGSFGNLIGVLEVLHKHGLLPAWFWIWLDIRDLKVPPVPSNEWIPDRFIWWWRGSRVLTDYNLVGNEQEVIDEFPFFSFLLGDVHPHVLALPFVLLVVTLALNLLANNKRGESANGRIGEVANGRDCEIANEQLRNLATSPIRNLKEPGLIDKFLEILQNSWSALLDGLGGRLAFGLYAIAIGGLSFLNTWDFPIYLAVVGITFTVWLYVNPKNQGSSLLSGLIGTGILAIAALILYLPFYATFQSQAKGILPNLWNPTRLPQFFVFFGPFLVAIMGWLTMLSSKRRGWQNHLSWSLPLTLFGPILAMLVILGTILLNPAGRDYINSIINNPEIQPMIGGATLNNLLQTSLWRRLTNPWTFLFLGGLLGWALALLVNLNEIDIGIRSQELGIRNSEKFVLILLMVGLALPLSVEFIFLRDNFGYRMNTIFKFYFQAWVLLALVAAFAVYYVSHHLRGIYKYGWNVTITMLVMAGMFYPMLAIADKTNYFHNKPTLDGMAWIKDFHPGDYAAIVWLRENAPANAIILESPGSGYASYQYTGRVSALTGIPTLLGWGGHQSQWRGNYDEPARREPDIEQLFNGLDAEKFEILMNKYQITTIYIGTLERERYRPESLRKFDLLMDVAFQKDEVTIYKKR